MGGQSNIEWTDATWTPIRARREVDGITRVGWHCEHASPGCVNCYSETMNRAGRSPFTGTRLPYKPGHRGDVEIFLDEKMLLEPLRWRKPRMVFVCSMTDLFGEFVPDEMFDRVFAVMALCPQHTFQVLTKRAERMREYLEDRVRITGNFNGLARIAAMADELGREIVPAELRRRWPLPNVWLGVSVEDQQRADERIPDLLATPAAVRFLSCEPLLGPVDLHRFLYIGPEGGHEWWGAKRMMLGWVIAGGESGPRARPMHPDWARSLRDQCAAAGVPFFFKQWGEWLGGGPGNFEASNCRGLKNWQDDRFSVLVGKKAAGRLLDAVEHNGMPG